jgi:hypothetical protein
MCKLLGAQRGSQGAVGDGAEPKSGQPLQPACVADGVSQRSDSVLPQLALVERWASTGCCSGGCDLQTQLLLPPFAVAAASAAAHTGRILL